MESVGTLGIPAREPAIPNGRQTIQMIRPPGSGQSMLASANSQASIEFAPRGMTCSFDLEP